MLFIVLASVALQNFYPVAQRRNYVANVAIPREGLRSRQTVNFGLRFAAHIDLALFLQLAKLALQRPHGDRLAQFLK